MSNYRIRPLREMVHYRKYISSFLLVTGNVQPFSQMVHQLNSRVPPSALSLPRKYLLHSYTTNSVQYSTFSRVIVFANGPTLDYHEFSFTIVTDTSISRIRPTMEQPIFHGLSCRSEFYKLYNNPTSLSVA